MSETTENPDETAKARLQALDTLVELLVGRELAAAREAAGDLESRLFTRITTTRAELDTKLNAVQETVQERFYVAEQAHKSALTDLEARLMGKADEIERQLGTLAEGLSSLQLELQGQMEASERVTAILDTMADAFSGIPRVVPSAVAAEPENIDHAIDRMFDRPDADDDAALQPR